MAIDPFLVPMPDVWKDDPQIVEFIYQLKLLLDELTRPEGTVAVIEETVETVVVQEEAIQQNETDIRRVFLMTGG